MKQIYLMNTPDWEELKKIIADEIRGNLESKPKRFLKSAEVRKMLGGVSASKLQSLRIGSHLPAINADGLWLYDVDDIINFINKNKTKREEVER